MEYGHPLEHRVIELRQKTDAINASICSTIGIEPGTYWDTTMAVASGVSLDEVNRFYEVSEAEMEARDALNAWYEDGIE